MGNKIIRAEKWKFFLPMDPSSGHSTVGVMTSILMAASIVCDCKITNQLRSILSEKTEALIFASADPSAEETAPAVKLQI